jgi:DNA-binding FadR family transcriptional regulator
MDSAAALRATLLDNLARQTWRPGQRLPTERALSDQYGLSRSSVRRVLLELKRLRLVTQTVGSGTYVADDAPQVLAQMQQAHAAAAISPADLMAARIALEPALVDMVIGNATAADFARMDECNARAEAAPTLEEFENWDGALHEAIAAAAHNGLIARVFCLMNEARTQGEWGVLKRRSVTPERRREYERQHRELVAALKDRDAARARRLCARHLAQVRHNLLGY